MTLGQAETSFLYVDAQLAMDLLSWMAWHQGRGASQASPTTQPLSDLEAVAWDGAVGLEATFSGLAVVLQEDGTLEAVWTAGRWCPV